MSLSVLGYLVDQIPRIKSLDYYHPEFQEWHTTVKLTLREVFGEASFLVDEYAKIAWHTSDKPEDIEAQGVLYNKSCNSAEGILKAAISKQRRAELAESSTKVSVEVGKDTGNDSAVVKNPKVFISYSWDNENHKRWVHDFSARLRGDGVDVELDQWETSPGDQLPAFMEQAIRNNEYVLIVCTPRYKERSDNREGGVGYEGDIMTAEVYTTGNRNKFIPILRQGSWNDSAPDWLKGSYYVDLRGRPYEESRYRDLLLTLYKTRPAPPPLGPIPDLINDSKSETSGLDQPKPVHNDIRILGVIVDEVSEPRRNGTKGSELYRIPLKLSSKPSSEWAAEFIQVWKHPPHFTTMHRPRIATVRGDKIILDGTTIEELENYHRDTLVEVVQRVNENIKDLEIRRRKEDEESNLRSATHRKIIEDRSKRLDFD